MATDIERLIVQMGADFRAYTNEIAKVSGVSRKEFAKIKREAEAAGANIERAMVGFGRGAQASTGNVVAFRTGVQQAAFQIQDFAVQVQSGTSATVALGQQLPQLLGAFGVLGSVVGAGVAVGLPLIVSAFRNMGDEAVPLEERMKSLTEALNAVKEAAELQSMSIDELTKRYGENDAAVQQLIASTARLAVDQALAQVNALRSSFSEFVDLTHDTDLAPGLGAAMIPVIDEVNSGVRALTESFGISVEQAEQLQQAFIGLSQANGVDAVFQALVNVLQTIEQSRDETGNLSGEMTTLATEVQGLADTVGQVRGGVEEVTAATGAAVAAAQGLAAAWGAVAQASAQAAQMAAAASREAGNRAAPGTFATPKATPFGGTNDFPLFNPPPDASDFPVFHPTPVAVSSSGGGGGRRSGGGGGSSAASRADAEAVRGQQTAIRDAIREVERAQRDLERRNERVAASFADVFTDAITGARSLQESIAGIAQQLGSLLVQRGFETLLNAGGGGGPLGFLFGGARANGGPVGAGRAYLVGERGPEMFVPRMAGAIVPNKSSGGSAVLNYAPVIDARGADTAAVARIQAELRAQSETFRDRVNEAIRDPRLR